MTFPQFLFLQSWLTAVSTPVKNHGIPNETSDGALQMAKEFFALPEETKMEVGFASRT